MPNDLFLDLHSTFLQVYSFEFFGFLVVRFENFFKIKDEF